MMKKALLIMILIVLTATVVACGAGGTNTENGNTNSTSGAGQSSAQEVTITHELGETKVKHNPQKVVVFDMGALDTMDKLGIDVTALPQSTIPSYLSKFKSDQYKNAGGLTEPDFEAIAALNPDLIIISARQSASYEEFTKIGPTLFLSLDTNRYMESFANNVKLIGQLFGKEAEAEEHLDNILASVSVLKEKVTAEGINGLVVLTTGGKVSAYGVGSRFGLVYDEFGVTPADPNIEASTHGMSISFEYIVEKNPDYLFVVDRDAVVGGGGSTAKEVIENDLVKNTQAYQNGNIVYLDPNYWYLAGGGLVSVAEMVTEMNAGLK